MGLTSCPNCGCTELASNDAQGEKTCMGCGNVLEEGVMVEAVTFSDSGMHGQRVSFNTGGTIGARGYGTSRGSREQVLQRGRNNIQRIAEGLRLPEAHQESAHRIFILAVQRSFTVGRHGRHVAAACLYVICRRQKTPHMLIDFSDVLRVPVKTLGQMFVKLVLLLHIPVPQIDPSLFMERYASHLQLDNKTQVVAATGVRLIQAMTRDWIATGRRPSGLCGAALLIAARYHGFKINASDMVPIVRISSRTLEKRLTEFRGTSTAALTPEKFEAEDLQKLPILNGPPCFEAAKRREARRQLAIANGEDPDASRRKEEGWSDGLSDEDEEEEENEEVQKPDEVEDLFSGLEEVAEAQQGGKQKEIEETDDAAEEARGEEAGEPITGAASLEAAAVSLEGISQELLCSENPTPADIEMIAAEMISAIDRRTMIRQQQSGRKGVVKATASEEVSGCVELMPSTKVAEEQVQDATDDEDGDFLGAFLGEDAAGALVNHAARDKAKKTPQHSPVDTDSTIDTQGVHSLPSTGEKANSAPLASADGDFDPGLFEASDNLQEGKKSNDLLDEVDPLTTLLREVCEMSSHLLPERDATGEEKSGGGDSCGREIATCTALARRDVPEGDETLSDVSDSEICEMLLTEKEKRTKTLIWDEMTKEVMPEVHRRLKERKRKEQEDKKNPTQRKRRKGQADAYPEAASAAASVRMALERKAGSVAKRINDDVLDALFS